MTTTTPSVAEITSTAIALLCREIGSVNTARFLNQFTTGFGNYTEERDGILGDSTVEGLVAEIKQRREQAGDVRRLLMVPRTETIGPNSSGDSITN